MVKVPFSSTEYVAIKKLVERCTGNFESFLMHCRFLKSHLGHSKNREMGRIIFSLRFLLHTLIVVPLSFFTGKKWNLDRRKKWMKSYRRTFFTVIGQRGEILRTFRNQITTEPKPGYIGEPFYLTASVTFALYSLLKFSPGNKWWKHLAYSTKLNSYVFLSTNAVCF